MKTRTTLSWLLALCLTAALALTAIGRTHAASPTRAAGATAPTDYHITAGWGDDDYAANIYTPSTIQIYAGDTITWQNNSLLEPHTISFGPAATLARLARGLVAPVPTRNGPPQLTLAPRVALPTGSPTYNGTGYANSGLLGKGGRWSITFTRPGTYRYYCLIHFPAMSGLVVVHPRPRPAHTYMVRSGYGPDQSPVDAFFPEKLRIHVGDTVRWSPGFHTVSFGPASLLAQLRHQFIVTLPQKHGPPTLLINPRIAYPHGGRTFDGRGFWTSGILQSGPTQLTFTHAGVYHYACLIHPGMDGTITVAP